MNAADRAAFVAKTKLHPQREVMAKIYLEPSGDHRIRLHLSGSPLEYEMSQQEAVEAVELLKKCIAELVVDDSRPTERTNTAIKWVE